MVEKLKKLVIDRARWIRGKGYGDSMLYRPQDKNMCCVGFYARQCKDLSVKQIKGRHTLHEIGWDLEAALRDPKNPGQPHQFYKVNDDPTMPSRDREVEPRTMFKRIGVACTFVGKTLGPKRSTV